MDHTRPRHVRQDPAPSDPDPDDPPATGPGRSRGHVLDRLYLQWREGPPEGERPILLQHTVLEDPEGAPYLTLLAGDLPDPADLERIWDETQRAADATILGRLCRPIVALEPLRGRWTVVRAAIGGTAPEPVSHEDPRSALQAARARFGEILRRGGIAHDAEALLGILGGGRDDEGRVEAPDPSDAVPDDASRAEPDEAPETDGEVRP